jgi:hypothetical protein
MAPTKTTKKNAPSKSKATQAKGKEIATSTAALQTAKKNAPSKSKATQAKGKENAASTAALQAAKKKNQLRKGSDLGMSYRGLNDSSTPTSSIFFLYPGFRTALTDTNTPEANGAGGGSATAATSAAEEIEQLKGQFLPLSCTLYMETHMWNWQRRFSFSERRRQMPSVMLLTSVQRSLQSQNPEVKRGPRGLS